MHKRRKQPAPKPSSAAALVHNLAASQRGVVNNSKQCQKVIGSFACGPVRSGASRSTRAQERPPAGSEASVPKSERTTSREDSVSGRLRTEVKAEAAQTPSRTLQRKSIMPFESPFANFGALDWAKHHHHAVIVDHAGQIVAEFSFSPAI